MHRIAEIARGQFYERSFAWQKNSGKNALFSGAAIFAGGGDDAASDTALSERDRDGSRQTQLASIPHLDRGVRMMFRGEASWLAKTRALA
jgi:hypothetical protein